MGITPQAYKEMQQRLCRGPAKPQPVLPETGPSPRGAGRHGVLLGLDPSLRGTGYGVIRLARPFPETIEHGTISCATSWEHSRCLVKISQTLRDVIARAKPTVCIVEGLFFAQNLQTALIMGEARGAALAVVAEAGLEIFEMAPRKVKQAIVGYGAAQKLAVSRMVQRMLRLSEAPSPDAADALALALTHAQEQGRFMLNQPKRI